MTDHLVPLARIVEARELVATRLRPTPLLGSSTAARIVEAGTGIRLGDGRLHLKAEHLQPTGSYKVRGMTWKVGSLDAAAHERGIITLSAGNAAQAYAWAGGRLGVRTTVVMPAAAVRTKVEACLGYGAEVILFGAHVGETLERLHEIERERGLVFCHPFDDPEVIAGHGSLGLEVLDDLPEVDVVVAGVGGGGMIAGLAAALKERRPSVRVYGVEPVGSDAMTRAIAAGHPVTITPTSVADGLGAPFAGEWTLAMCQRYVDGMILVDDPSILAGVRFAVERMKQVLEPAGAAALAAVLFGRIPIRDGERVCVIASGGNVAVDRLGELLEMAAPLAAPGG